eukprot:TRINITY_DN13242_c4_g2_i1.p1 TRINITY_DN13242_c4_g2~~TRINITY_DN13242_c4_g2_i1.p1  ORF type:complete len:177 (+),score=66.24 TRINITY_DN13242_c4_g2_i1:42-572(+)
MAKEKEKKEKKGKKVVGRVPTPPMNEGPVEDGDMVVDSASDEEHDYPRRGSNKPVHEDPTAGDMAPASDDDKDDCDFPPVETVPTIPQQAVETDLPEEGAMAACSDAEPEAAAPERKEKKEKKNKKDKKEKKAKKAAKRAKEQAEKEAKKPEEGAMEAMPEGDVEHEEESEGSLPP